MGADLPTAARRDSLPALLRKPKMGKILQTPSVFPDARATAFLRTERRHPRSSTALLLGICWRRYHALPLVGLLAGRRPTSGSGHGMRRTCAYRAGIFLQGQVDAAILCQEARGIQEVSRSLSILLLLSDLALADPGTPMRPLIRQARRRSSLACRGSPGCAGVFMRAMVAQC